MNIFTIADKLPSLNDVIRANRGNCYQGNYLKHKVQKKIGGYIEKAVGEGTLKEVKSYPVMVDFEWHERTKKRDADNIASAKKFILDEMVNQGIIKNDSRKYVKGFTDEIVDDKADFVIVTISENDIGK